MAFLRDRNRQPELMDQPELDDDQHRAALAGLGRVNKFSRTDAVLWSVLRPLAESQPHPLRILDVACGGGDLAIRLARRSRRTGLQLQIEGCDMSATAIQFASENAAHHGLTSLRFTQRNILAEPLDHGAYDIVMCTLFLHHLDEDDAVKVLQTMQNGACRMVVVDDLLRTQFGYWLAWLGTRLLTRCHVVHVDGPMSVEGAFTRNEAKNLARKAGLSNVRLSTHWPQRFLLTAAVQNEASRDES